MNRKFAVLGALLCACLTLMLYETSISAAEDIGTGFGKVVRHDAGPPYVAIKVPPVAQYERSAPIITNYNVAHVKKTYAPAEFYERHSACRSCCGCDPPGLTLAIGLAFNFNRRNDGCHTSRYHRQEFRRCR